MGPHDHRIYIQTNAHHTCVCSIYISCKMEFLKMNSMNTIAATIAVAYA